MEPTDPSRAERRRKNAALLSMIAEFELTDPIDQEHIDWAKDVLDRHGVPRAD